jgi:hypothetical protein
MMRDACISMLAALAFVVLGCDESFSPKAEFHEQYVLQCFMQGDNSRAPAPMTVVLAKTYDVDGYDPSVNDDDPSIAGAEIMLTYESKNYYLNGTKRASRDTSRYHTQQWVYLSAIPSPRPDALVKLTARLPNGKTLSGQTTVPRARNIASNYEFAAGLTGRFNFAPGKPNWVLSWENYDETEVHLFVPKLTIQYTKLEGEVETSGTVTVASKYVSSSGGIIPAYPALTTEKSCTFEFAALDSAMAQISGGDPQKWKYGTHLVLLELIEYDTPLTKYFSSINGSLDQYSIRTDESVFSNVGGGIGIVGSYMVHKIMFLFDERYVANFGYRLR